METTTTRNAWIEFLRANPMPGRSMKARVAEYKRRKRRTLFEFRPRSARDSKQQQQPFSSPSTKYTLGVHNLDPSTSVSLTSSDVAAVRSPRGWISDNVLTGFQSLLAPDFARRRVVAMDCLQMTTGVGGKNRPHVGHQHLVRYGLSSTDVPSMIVFPLHVAGAHWVVLTYEPGARRWTSWDSLHSACDGAIDLTPYVDACHARLKRFFSDNEAVVPQSGTYDSHVRKTGLPRQLDGHSCGLWACTYLYMISQGYDRFDPGSQAVADPAAYVASVRRFLSDAVVTRE